jgi:hypothetical protein
MIKENLPAGASAAPEAKGDGGKLTYSVPEAGAMAGLSKNGSYEAAKRGEIPTIKFGGRFRVPGKTWRAKLNGEVAA